MYIPRHFAAFGYFLPEFKAPLSRIVCQNKHPPAGIASRFCCYAVALLGCRISEMMVSHAAFASLEVLTGQQGPSCKKKATWGPGDSLFWLPMCPNLCSLLPLSVLLDYAIACYSHTFVMQWRVYSMTFQGQKCCFFVLPCCLQAFWLVC